MMHGFLPQSPWKVAQDKLPRSRQHKAGSPLPRSTRLAATEPPCRWQPRLRGTQGSLGGPTEDTEFVQLVKRRKKKKTFWLQAAPGPKAETASPAAPSKHSLQEAV